MGGGLPKVSAEISSHSENGYQSIICGFMFLGYLEYLVALVPWDTLFPWGMVYICGPGREWKRDTGVLTSPLET